MVGRSLFTDTETRKDLAQKVLCGYGPSDFPECSLGKSQFFCEQFGRPGFRLIIGCPQMVVGQLKSGQVAASGDEWVFWCVGIP